MTRILFVCLGNICRSPTAEGMFRHLALLEAPSLQVEADSAGTADYHIGASPDPRSRHAARARQIDISGLRARQLKAADFTEFDFILGMDRANIVDIESMRPPGGRANVQLFMEYAPELGKVEVPDPYYLDAAAFEEVLDLTAAASRGLIAFLQQSSE